MSPGPVLRTQFAAALAASACCGCLYPDLTVPPENDQIVGSIEAPTDGCPSWPKASDYEALSVDFENMATPRDGFELGKLKGVVSLGVGVGDVNVFIRGGYSEPSKRSLLLTFDKPGSTQVDLVWKDCLNALTRRGVGFWAKGTASTLNVMPQLAIGAADAACLGPIVRVTTLTPEWQWFEHSWTEFCPLGPAVPDFPRKLVGISFGAVRNTPDSWFALDDVTFTN